MAYKSSVLVAASLASVALAKTDLTGCTSTDVSSPAGASVAWYVPGTGELCDFLDCGGGRAPPKYTVPGCPQYTGTETYSPSYLPGYGSMTSAPAASTPAASSWSESSTGEWADASSSEWASSTTATDFAGSSTTATSAGVAESSGSSVPQDSVSTWSTSVTGITSAPVVAGTGGAVAGGHNGTLASATPRSTTSSTSIAGAMETARVWMGGAGLLGLGAIVAVL